MGKEEVPGLRKEGGTGWDVLASVALGTTSRVLALSEGMAHCRLVALSLPAHPLLSSIKPSSIF